MAGGGDPDNRHDFPGGWREDAKNAFSGEWAHAGTAGDFSFVQNLLRVRREHPALSEGRQWNLLSDESAIVFLRESDEEKVLVAFNRSKSARELQVAGERDAGGGSRWEREIVGRRAWLTVNGKELWLERPAESISIFLAELESKLGTEPQLSSMLATKQAAAATWCLAQPGREGGFGAFDAAAGCVEDAAAARVCSPWNASQ